MFAALLNFSIVDLLTICFTSTNTNLLTTKKKKKRILYSFSAALWKSYKKNNLFNILDINTLYSWWISWREHMLQPPKKWNCHKLLIINTWFNSCSISLLQHLKRWETIKLTNYVGPKQKNKTKAEKKVYDEISNNAYEQIKYKKTNKAQRPSIERTT